MAEEMIPNIPQEKFALVNENRPLHDKELATKPIGYFHDAFNRFARNKGAIVAAIVIGILVLYAIIAPMVSQYSVSYTDTYYALTLPKWYGFENANFLDGCSKKTLNEASFVYYYGMGLETGHNAVKNQYYTVSTTSTGDSSTSQMYTFRLDSYEMNGCIFLSSVSAEDYAKIQQYQDETGREVIYPITQLSLRPTAPAFRSDANYWYTTKLDQGKAVPSNYVINADGTVSYQNIYAPVGFYADNYTSKVRMEGETALYSYARPVQGGAYEIRVNYHEYYVYRHAYVLKDGIGEPYFLFGTTNSGQDLFTCLASGARFSFVFAILVAVVNLAVGAVWGAIAGYYGGRTDLIMERITDILSAVPFMIVITLLKYHFSTGNNHALLLFISFFATGWIGMAGTVRMQFYRFKNQEYVLAARTLGASDKRIMFKHIFPNSLGTIITSCVLIIPSMIFSETSLSYLGIINLGAGGNMTSVGTLLAAGQPYLASYPHTLLTPSLFISLLMLSFNLVGNGLRDAFNPSLRGTED